MAVLLNVIARTMNAGGSAIVSAFDAGSAAFNCTMSALSPGERSKLAGRIKEQEKKINALSAGIAKETSKFADPAAALESATVIGLLNAIKELHKEIEPMKQRIAAIDAIKGAKNPQEKPCGIPCVIGRAITGILPGEKAGLKRKIFANEKKIRQLYVDFAREVAKQPDPFEAINSSAVAAINAKINELNSEISAFKLQLADLDKPKPKPEKQKPAEKKPQPDAKKAPAESSGVAKFFINAIAESVSGYLPGEKSSIERKLAECDKKIQGLYLDVAKESAKHPDPADAITAAPVVALVAKINELKAEVATLNQRKAELSPVAKAEKAKAAATSAKGAVTPKPAKPAAAPAKDEPVLEVVPVEAPVLTEAVAPAKDEPVTEETPAVSTVAAEAVSATDEPVLEVVPVEAPVLTEAVAQEKVEPVIEEVPVESPVSTETVGAVDAVDASAALPVRESAVIKAVATTSAHAEGEPSKIRVTVSAPALESVAKLTELSGIDPEEGSTPYVYSRTKWPDIPVPVMPQPTEEDIKAVVHEIEEEIAAAEPVIEEAVTSSDETIAESAVEEKLAVAADVPVETVAEKADQEVDDLPPVSEVASVEHPPFVPVPEAEDVFRVHEPLRVKSATAVKVPQESALEAEAAEAVVTEEVAPVLHDALETSPESSVEATSEETSENPPVIAAPEEAAEASPEEVPAPSAPVDADGVVADHPPIIPGLRPDTVVKEESGSGFRTRLFRNQFSILTPVPVETPVSDPAPPTREEVETVASTMQADDVEKYKLNEILEGQETPSETEESAKPEGEGSEELDATDYFEKLSKRRKALLSGEKEVHEKGHSRKHKLTPED